VLPLTGVVRDPLGDPLADAQVFVTGIRQPDTAAADRGIEYPTGGTPQTTDALGRFTFEKTIDSYSYELTAIADGYTPGTYLGADPLRGEIEIRLKPTTTPSVDEFVVRVRLEDDAGKPVAGARIEPEGVSSSDGSTRWGGSQGFPSMVVSDSTGAFYASRKEPFEQLQLNIQAAGLASAKIWVPATNTVQVVKLGVGGSLTGRVTKDGQPLANVMVGFSGTDRNSMVYAGNYETATDDAGRFQFRSLPPSTSWQLYGLIYSMKPHGAVPPPGGVTMTRGHGTTNDVGDLTVEPGLTLQGKLIPVTETNLPAGALKVLVSHNGM